jgi:hypothetical protein
MITAHKKLTALKKLYEHHAKDCVRVAELTVDPRRREQYLKLAREWTEAAAALRVCIDEIERGREWCFAFVQIDLGALAALDRVTFTP